jgi:hypothetical protein
MSSVIDVEAQLVAQATPRAGATTVEMVTACKEEVEGAETHKMNILGPHVSSHGVASSLRPVSTGQDINDEAQPVVQQPEGLTSICPCCRSRDDCFALLQDAVETASPI